MAKKRILVADDHYLLRRSIVRALSEAGHEVEEAANGNAAIEQLHNGQFDVVVSDLQIDGNDGLDVLRTAKTLHPDSSVILMTTFGSIQTAVEAMRIGAFDYVQKPFKIEEVELKIDKALQVRQLKHEIDYLRHTQPAIYDFDRIIGASGALQRVLDSDVVFRTWGDAYGYALVATGRAEAMIDPLANPWDIAPMAVIIPEAGGRFSNFDGVERPDSWNRNSGVATNGILHDDLIGLFTD